VNILLTSTGSLEDRDHKHLIKTWRDHHHIVETMPFERVMGYLKVDPANGPLSTQSSAKLILIPKAARPTRCPAR
jgi:hypothetical protein